jgi:hypothetical protein
VLVWVDGEYLLEHRVVMARAIGRALRPEEQVHHVNHLKTDNRLKNLMLFPDAAAHARYHQREAQRARQESGQREVQVRQVRENV